MTTKTTTQAVELKNDRDSRALVLFLQHLHDDVELMRVWAQKLGDEHVLTKIYDRFIALAQEVNEKEGEHLDGILAALLITACSVANSGGYSKAAVLKAVYEIPWPHSYDADREACQVCEKRAQCKDDYQEYQQGFAPSCNAPGGSA
tara:strand:+ start:71 stop:511 length:441 start_codon:yes stop_codon:yes gene_type:complete